MTVAINSAVGVNFAEIPPLPPALRNTAQQKKLVIFVGAGVSRLFGAPSWEEMARKLLQQLIEANYLSYAESSQLRELDPKIKISIAMDLSSTNNFKPNFQEVLKPTYESTGTAYQDLYSIGTPIVTTNYDDFLDQIAESQLPVQLKAEAGTKAVDQSGEVPLPLARRVYFRREDLRMENLQPGNVLHLHGSMRDITSMVLTTKDYMEHYNNPIVSDFLRELFASKTILFIGYGLDEEEILGPILRSRKSNGSKSQSENHYRLFPRYSHEGGLFQLLRRYYQNHCNVDLIDFCIDKRDHRQLSDVLRRWASELKPTSEFLDKIKTIDEALSG